MSRIIAHNYSLYPHDKKAWQQAHRIEEREKFRGKDVNQNNSISYHQSNTLIEIIIGLLPCGKHGLFLFFIVDAQIIIPNFS